MGRLTRLGSAVRPLGSTHNRNLCDHGSSRSCISVSWNQLRHNAAATIRRLPATAGIARRITPHALQGAAHRADPTVSYDQSKQSFHRDATFVLIAATARRRHVGAATGVSR